MLKFLKLVRIPVNYLHNFNY